MSIFKLIYDERTSNLYSPDGKFLKQLFCPKAKHWNQLLASDKEDRWRGCESCGERVINLDTMTVEHAVEALVHSRQTCVYVSSDSEKVVFLADAAAVPDSSQVQRDHEDRVVIRTARTIEGINRAAGIGYWPDVRFVEYRDSELVASISVGQHIGTGRIEASGDFRRGFGDQWLRGIWSDDENREDWIQVFPFRTFYPNYQSEPIAAYLIPRDLPDKTMVTVEDPIEDIVGRVGQGVSRATCVPGRVESRKVILDRSAVKVRHVVG